MRLGGFRRHTRRRHYGGYRGGAHYKLRLIIGLVVAGFALVSFIKSSSFNPVTGERQFISMTPRQEIALGLQAAPQLMRQYGGLHPDNSHQEKIDRIGERLVNAAGDLPISWQWEFHLLEEPRIINAFALPGGQVFITRGLYDQLRTGGQIAGVIGHEIGHVLARHGAQKMAKSNLTQGLIGAVLAASGDYETSRLAAMVGQMVNMKYGREDELESDHIGLKLMVNAGFDPYAMVSVMHVLEQASAGRSQPEFFSTHPNPENRIEKIETAIKTFFPEGLPPGLEP